MTDLDTAEELTARALDVARAAGDGDLELIALAQLGHVRVGKGDAAGGFALLDEAVAAALAGDRSTLDTVVYTCCDMLNACELADDLERAAQWCQVADDFVATYGCPFLYAECGSTRQLSSSASSVVPSGSSSTVRWPYCSSRVSGLAASASVPAVRSVGCSDIAAPSLAFAGDDHRTRGAGVRTRRQRAHRCPVWRRPAIKLRFPLARRPTITASRP